MIVVMADMLLVNVILAWCHVLLRKLVKVQVAAANISIVLVRASICILPQIVHRRVLSLVIHAVENITDALVRPVLVPVLSDVPNIIHLLALPFVKALKQTTVITEPQFQPLMDVLNIGQTVLLNVKRLIRIIAVTERPLLANMAVLLILGIVLPNVRLAGQTQIVM